jgi:predicted AAA+ superfamily ATPase
MEINRGIFPRLVEELKRREISILLGPRQVGKSFLLRKLEAAAKILGMTTFYFDLELPHDLRLFNKPDEELFQMLTNSGDVIFIDEFHYLKNASRVFKAVFDSGKRRKIVCSGSSSIEMHKHLQESLAGRRLVTTIAPLSFIEYRQIDAAAAASKLYSSFVTFGALPGLINIPSADEKMRVLEELLATYIQKDVKSLIREENVRAFNTLLYLLAERQGSMISVNSLATEIGLTAAAVTRHLDILENTYVAHSLFSHAHALGNELKKSRKIYLYDLGIRNALLRDFSHGDSRRDGGAVHETFAYLELRKLLKPNRELKLWRTKAGDEVDFVLLTDRRPLPIEVKSTLNRPEVPKAIIKFLRVYPEAPGAVVLSTSLRADAEVNGKPVIFRALAETAEAVSVFA